MSNPHYSRLLRAHIKQEDSKDDVTRKKRRLGARESSVDPETRTESNLKLQIDQQDESDLDSDEFEDVEIDGEKDPDENQEVVDGGSDEDRDYSFLNTETNENEQEEGMTINIVREQPPQPTRKKVNFIGKEERSYRVQYHQWCILTMICHGVMRNKWCNDYNLLVSLRNAISPDILDELQSIRTNKRMSLVNAVRFTDVVRELMFAYSRKFRVSRQGLVRRNWNELGIPQTNTEKNVTFERFLKLCLSFQGSKDIGAQSFVALARALGMKARLVFSIQPPDFTMVTELPEIQLKPLRDEKPKPEPKKPVNSKQAFLNKSRSNKVTETETNYKFDSSSYPIFWAEIWNKFNRKWLAVDPFTLRVVEQPPMRRKSSFEPPMSDNTNNLVYAIAFDSQGGVKDVTRRYAQQYNSRTVKKRIGTKSEQYADWYDKVIQVCSRGSSKLTKGDILELKEFRDRDLAEGMPNSAAGFKDHPMYALESQLRQNEIISPMDASTKCGSFRFKVSPKSKNTSLVPVYKRSAVHILRSAKAWYLRGRLLKVGQQPLKIKTVKKRGNLNDSDDETDDENSQRLYAEYQTKQYIPPPLQEGVIPKNAYGNIDIYVPTMIPEGGHLLEATPDCPIKLMEKAARILEIDYAKAIVAFDFGKNGKRGRRAAQAQAREGGILIHEDHKDGIKLIIDQLLDESVQQERKQAELLALRSWKFFLTKIRIKSRLDKQHGKVIKPRNPNKSGNFTPEVNDEEASSDYSVYSEDEASENEASESEGYEAGGFVPTEINMGAIPDPILQTTEPVLELVDMLDGSEEESGGGGGGFLVEADELALSDPTSNKPEIHTSQPQAETSRKTPKEHLTESEKNPSIEEINDDSSNQEDDGSDLMEIPEDDFILLSTGELLYNPQPHEAKTQSLISDNETVPAEFKAQIPVHRAHEDKKLISKGISEASGSSDGGSPLELEPSEEKFEFEYSDED